MKTLNIAVSLALIALFAGCGGGGASSGSESPPITGTTAPVGTPLTTAAKVTNRLSGVPAPGVATSTIRGMAYTGAVVTAYAVQSDGSAGAALGAAVATDINGFFTITAGMAPLRMMRLVAAGGKVTRAALNHCEAMSCSQRWRIWA